ncbi:MAG: hypothetical protein CMM50_06835 [Rhodospirillaceae bacterium]|nr:hypothetical protein [Rhodospirillaceae bacterium]|tara:strand:- start:63 stop:959 length:897 start_codon:yes stop_codon:yes gene_type:complete
MRLRPDLAPFQRSVPTKASLDFAEQIAALTGLPFDREAVAADSLSLHETMFADLVRILGLEADEIEFRSGSYFAVRAFAVRAESGAAHVGLDLTFDYWLAALAHLGVIATCEVLSQAQLQAIARQVNETFLLFEDASRFRSVREGLKPYLAGYPHLINLSEGLGRAMLVFTLCHELAHCRLGHLDRPGSREIELEADRAAAELFLEVGRHGESDRATTVHVDPKVAGAPIILMHLLALHEAWLTFHGITLDSTRPRAAERLAGIEPLIRPSLDEIAAYVVDGVANGIADIRSSLIGTG